MPRDHIASLPGYFPGERAAIARARKDIRLGITRIPTCDVDFMSRRPDVLRPVGDLLIEVEGISMLFDGGQFDTSENKSIEPSSVGIGIFSDLVTLKRRGK